MSGVEKGHLTSVTLPMARTAGLAASPSTRLRHSIHRAANHARLRATAVISERFGIGERGELISGGACGNHRTIGLYTFLSVHRRPMTSLSNFRLFGDAVKVTKTPAQQTCQGREVIVILINRPYHDSSQANRIGPVDFLFEGLIVVKADPLIIVEHNVVDCGFLVVDNLRLLIFDDVLNLKVGQRASVISAGSFVGCSGKGTPCIRALLVFLTEMSGRRIPIPARPFQGAHYYARAVQQPPLFQSSVCVLQ